MKNIASFTDGQATISQFDEDNLAIFQVEFKPNDGLYKGGTFVVQFDCSSYADDRDLCPYTNFITPIYHPNIDCLEYRTERDFESSNVCLNLLDDWTAERDMEDLVMGVLFLFYNPQIDDPLCPLVDSTITEEEFADNVARSLRGDEVDDYVFVLNAKEMAHLKDATNGVECDSEKTDATDNTLTLGGDGGDEGETQLTSRPDGAASADSTTQDQMGDSTDAVANNTTELDNANNRIDLSPLFASPKKGDELSNNVCDNSSNEDVETEKSHFVENRLAVKDEEDKRTLVSKLVQCVVECFTKMW